MMMFLGGRLSLLIVTSAILIFFSYELNFWFPTDLITSLSGITNPSDEQLVLLQQHYHLHENGRQQFIRYTELLVSGEWGVSTNNQLNVFQQMLEKLPATLELIVYSTLVSLTIGLPVGCLAGIKHYSSTDYSVLSFSLLGSSVPIFWFAFILVSIFSLQLGIFPTAGRLNILYDVPLQTGFIFVDIFISDIPNKAAVFHNALKHLALPTLSLSIVTTAMVIKITRRSTIDVMNSEFIKASLSRGFSPQQTLMRHGIKNILLPIVPTLTLQFTALLTNTMIIEMVFDWPGLGSWLLNALYQQDYPVIRAGLLVMATIVMLVIIIVDVMLRLLDPQKERDVHGTI